MRAVHDVINNRRRPWRVIASLCRAMTLPSRSFSTKSEQALNGGKEKAYEMRDLAYAHRHQESATRTFSSLATH